MKYPVKVSIGNGTYNYAMLSLEQANAKFVVVDGCLVQQNVSPMSMDYVIQQLTYEEECLADTEEYLLVLQNSRFSSTSVTKYEAEILERKASIEVLTQAKQHYEDYANV